MRDALAAPAPCTPRSRGFSRLTTMRAAMARAEADTPNQPASSSTPIHRLDMFASPGLIRPAYAEMLAPLIEALQRGLHSGVFRDVEPVTGAQFIHGVVWVGIDRQWTTGECDRDELRQRILHFVLRGLGV